MNQDNTIREYPKCEVCERPFGMIFYRTLLVCGDCLLKLQEKERNQYEKWVEEIKNG